MSKIVFLSWHYYGSKKRAGFHHLARAWSDINDAEVVFIHSTFSLLSILRKEIFLSELRYKQNLFSPLYFGKVKSLVNIALLRPLMTSKYVWLENLSFFLYRLDFRVRRELRKADIVVFESTFSILFFERVKNLNPGARTIYRASDDMDFFPVADRLKGFEKELLPKFDVVSVTTKSHFDKLIALRKKNLFLNYHGVSVELFEKCTVSPYSHDINAVFVGNSYLDLEFLEIASDLYPNIHWHIFGRHNLHLSCENIHYYNYVPFEETIGYIKYADIGLHTLKGDPKLMSFFTDSNKILQYSHMKLPIIAPSVIESTHRENFIYYNYGDINSIRNAIEESISFDRTKFKPDTYSWNALADMLKSALL